MSELWLAVDLHEADALGFAADYLAGFARICQLLDESRYPGKDLRDVIRTLRELQERVTASARAA
jgi:hypothetical protein